MFGTQGLWEATKALIKTGVLTGVQTALVSREPLCHLQRFLIADRLAPTFRPMGTEDEVVARYQEAIGPHSGTTLLRGGLVPVKAASLELGLSSLPRPDALFALGVDGPWYASVHSASAAGRARRSASRVADAMGGSVE